MNRSRQILELEASLGQLVEILHLDPQCQWRQHFESCLARAQNFVAGGFSQTELNELSSSVTQVYAGVGSFNDYAPANYDQVSGRHVVISGAERFSEVAGQVHEQALALRVVGNAL